VPQQVHLLADSSSSSSSSNHENSNNNTTDAPAAAARQSTPLFVSDVACGAAHVIAVSATSGALYVWGLNKSSQLGLDSQRTQCFPVEAPIRMRYVPDPSAASSPSSSSSSSSGAADGAPLNEQPCAALVRVYSHGHSSAAIDSRGRLFTWGSTAHHRLMHPLPLEKEPPHYEKVMTYAELRTARMACAKGNVGHFKASLTKAKEDAISAKMNRRTAITMITRPTWVRTPDLSECVVQNFAFAKTHSAALVLTCLKSVSILLFLVLFVLPYLICTFVLYL
jgi:alpha-tubulin suppressor-like RCC1 family protein